MDTFLTSQKVKKMSTIIELNIMIIISVMLSIFCKNCLTIHVSCLRVQRKLHKIFSYNIICIMHIKYAVKSFVY